MLPRPIRLAPPIGIPIDYDVSNDSHVQTIRAKDEDLIIAYITVSSGTESWELAELAFRIHSARRARGLNEAPISLHARSTPSGSSTEVPHLYVVSGSRTPRMAWEKFDATSSAERIFGQPWQIIDRWRQRADDLDRLTELSLAQVDAVDSTDHLSFQWVLYHEQLVLETLALEFGPRLGHISWHIPQDDLLVCKSFFCRALLFEEIPRPANISIPGTWLLGNNLVVHLNAREIPSRGSREIRGSAPNHVALLVNDLEQTCSRIETLGYLVTWSGSLGQRRQAWCRPGGNIVIELQGYQGAADT